jgi:1,4-dihydroxy-2-naphthoate octaprenyltransferase
MTRSDMPSDRPTPMRIWVTAARPKTLWAAISPVIVGAAFAVRDDALHWPASIAALAGALLIQITTNFANDLADFRRGVDTPDRRGPLRVTQAGWVTPVQMQRALVLIIGLALLIGVYLVVRGGWPIVIIGLASIGAALAYTGGPYPLGYHGLGDLFVFVFFGPIAVGGTYYVNSLTVTPPALLAGIAMGAFATAILIVNNLRDIETDRRSGKRTLTVRLGARGARIEYATLLLAAAVVPVILWWAYHLGTAALWATAVAMGGGIPLIRRLGVAADGPTFNRLLAATARLQAIYALALAIGINV